MADRPDTAPTTREPTRAPRSLRALDGLARYEILGSPIAGGAGRVVQARDRVTGTLIALKRGLGEAEPEVEAKLLAHEFRTLRLLGHPALPLPLDFGHDRVGRAFFAMEWVSGRSLEEQRELHGRRGILEVFSVLLRVLATFHRAGLVYLDLKPAHIRVGERLRLLDPGLAVEAGTAPALPGGITGTLPYVAPEVLQGRKVDARADLFSAGVMMLAALSGEVPFLAPTLAATARNILRRNPLEGATGLGEFPGLEALLGRLLAKNPAQRIPSATEAAAEVDALLESAQRDPSARREVADKSAVDPLPTVVVGRERLVAKAEARGLERRSENGVTLLFTGERGIGKSTVLQEVTARLEIAGYAAARIDFCRGGAACMARLAALLELWIDGESVDESGAATDDDDALPAAESDTVARVGRLLNRLSPSGRVLIALDGVEHADPVARRFLRNYVAVPTGLPVLFLLAECSPDGQAAPALPGDSPLIETLHLTPLGSEDLALLVTRLYGRGPGTRELSALLLRASGGSPLFAREYLRWLRRSGALVALPAGGVRLEGDPGIPRALTDLLFAGVRLLDSDLRRVLTRACVLQAPFPDDLLRRVAGAHADAPQRLVDQGYLRRAEDSGWLDVASGALREAVISGAGAAAHSALRVLHAQIVRAIEREGVPDGVDADALLAYHCLASGDPGSAVEHALAAGERAQARGAYDAAAALYDLLLTAVEQVTEHAEKAQTVAVSFSVAAGSAPTLLATALEKAAAAHQARGDLQAAAGLYERLLQELESTGESANCGGIAAARRQLATLCARLGKLEEARRLLAENLTCPAPEGAFAAVAWLRVLELAGDPLEALAAAEQLRGRFEELGQGALGAEFANIHGNLLTAAGRYEEAQEAYERSLDWRLNAGTAGEVAGSYNNLAILAWRRGEMQRALDWGSRALELRESARDRPGAADSLNTLGVLFAQEGHTQKALDCFAECLALKREAGELRGAAAAANNMAILQARVGESDAALRLYHIAEEIRRATGDREGLAKTLNNKGLAHARAEQWEEAAAAYRESLALKSAAEDPGGIASTLGNLGAVALQQGDWNRAQDLFDRSLDAARAAGNDDLILNAKESLALLATRRADFGRAAALWSEVLAQRRSGNRQALLVDTLLGVAELKSESGSWEEAAELLAEARVLAESLEDPRRICGILLACARLDIDAGRHAEALAGLNRAKLLAAGLSSTHTDGVLKRLEGQLQAARGERSAAAESLKESLRLLERVGCRFEHARTLEELAKLHAQQGAKEESRLLLAQVRRVYLDLGRKRVVGRMDLALPQDEPSRPQPARQPLKTTLLSRVAGLFASSRDIDSLMAETLDLLLAEVNAERGLVLLMNRLSGEFEVRAERNMDQGTIVDAEKISRNIINKVYQQEEVLYSSNAQHDDRFKGFKSLVQHRILSFICAPVRSRGVILGTIYVDNRSFMSPFREDDAELCKTFAAIAGMALENASLREEISARNRILEREVEQRYAYDNIVGKSKEMARVFAVIEKVKDVATSVLIQGETGTGKELIARAIHFNSKRKGAPFVAVDCGVLHENLIESELFGHVKGGFTGATSDRKGLVELAQDGTLFLDEIGNLDLGLQAKLLRVLQEGEYRPIGSAVSKTTNTRFICATNEDLPKMVEAGRFREDLYFRINVVSIRVPPLRERTDDIRLIAEHMIVKKAAEAGKEINCVEPAVMEAFFNHSWPGNVREMANTIERLVVLSPDGCLHFAHLPPEIAENARKTGQLSAAENGPGLSSLETMEKGAILAALEHSQWNQTRAAQTLGLTERNLRYKMKKHRIVNVHARRGRRRRQN